MATTNHQPLTSRRQPPRFRWKFLQLHRGRDLCGSQTEEHHPYYATNRDHRELNNPEANSNTCILAVKEQDYQYTLPLLSRFYQFIVPRCWSTKMCAIDEIKHCKRFSLRFHWSILNHDTKHDTNPSSCAQTWGCDGLQRCPPERQGPVGAVKYTKRHGVFTPLGVHL